MSHMACKTGRKRFDVLLMGEENAEALTWPHRNQFGRMLVVGARRPTVTLAIAGGSEPSRPGHPPDLGRLTPPPVAGAW